MSGSWSRNYPVVQSRVGSCRLSALVLMVFSFTSVLQSLPKSGQSLDPFSGSGGATHILMASHPGPAAARANTRNEIRALTMNVRLPSFFITVNPAGAHNPMWHHPTISFPLVGRLYYMGTITSTINDRTTATASEFVLTSR